MLTHDNIVVSGAERQHVRQLHARRHAARLSADGLGRRSHLLLRPGLCGRHVRGLPGEPRDHHRGSPRDRAHLFLRAAARVREPAHPDHGAHGGRRPPQEEHVRLLPRRGAPLRRADPRRQAGRLQGSPALPARRPVRLCAAAEPHGLLQDPRRLHGRRGDRAGAVPLLPLARHQPEAALRQTEASVYITLQPDGEVYSDTVGKPGPDVEIKIADSGEVLYQEPRRVPEVLQERRGDRARPRRPTAGCIRAMPASSTSAAT